MSNFENKKVLITGGASGIGLLMGKSWVVVRFISIGLRSASFQGNPSLLSVPTGKFSLTL